MTIKTVKLGGTASHITVGKVSLGMMTMTLNNNDKEYTDDDAFAAIKAGADALPEGAKLFLNSAEFYGRNNSIGNLELLARFYDKYPEYAEKTFLNVKGGTLPNSHQADSSPENLRRSVDTINAALRGTKRVDLFETARVAPNVPLEDAMKTLVQLKNEGKFDHIGMSECRAETLRRANAIHPIAAVEIEISLWSYEEETKKVIQTAAELGIAVLGYSPLGRGIFGGNIKSINDLPPDDYRRRLARYQEENLKANLALFEAVKAIAVKKDMSPAALCIAWVASLGPHVIPLPGSTRAKRVLENDAAGDIELSKADIDEIAEVMAKYEVKGQRYVDDPEFARHLHLWG